MKGGYSLEWYSFRGLFKGGARGLFRRGELFLKGCTLQKGVYSSKWGVLFKIPRPSPHSESRTRNTFFYAAPLRLNGKQRAKILQ